MALNKKLFNIGTFTIAGFVLITILIWSFIDPISTRFSDTYTTLYNLGRIAGLVGAVLFALTFVLTTKLKSVEKAFNGLDNVYRTHHNLGLIAFILLLFHPILLVTTYLPDQFPVAAQYLWFGASWPYNFGIAALMGMIILIGLTIYISIKYPTWKLSHKFMGVVFAIAMLHFFLITTDISRSLTLKSWMFAVSLIGISAHLYGSWLRPYTMKNYEYAVKAVEKQANFTEVYLESKSKEMQFKPGQFVFLRFNAQGFREVHPFTIASKPGKTIRFVIKNLGDYTSKLPSLKVGTIAEIDGPYGFATLDNQQSNKLVWVAGGVGITPFLSYLDYLKTHSTSKEITLFYCVKTREELIFMDEIMEAKTRIPNLTVIPFTSDEKGRINADIIENMAGKLNNASIVVCGPVPMMESLKEQFLSRGIENNNITMEDFALK